MFYPTHLFQNYAYERYKVKVVAQPAGEQLTLAEVRDHLRIISYACSPPLYEEDAWLAFAISVAREWCEYVTQSALAPQTLELANSMFPAVFSQWGNQGALVPYPFTWDNGIMLPMAAPLIAVDQIAFDDSQGNEVIMDPDDYYVDDYERPARVYPTPGASWPVAQHLNKKAVRIRYRAGYALPGDSPPTPALPFAIKAAMLLVIGHLHENRENSQEIKPEEIPLGAKSLLARYSVKLNMA